MFECKYNITKSTNDRVEFQKRFNEKYLGCTVLKGGNLV